MQDQIHENECFFIAPIGKEGTDTRKRSDAVFEGIIEDAAHALELHPAIRADMIGQPGIITTHIIEHILESKAVIADLTGRNPNVYYELAIRHTIKRPVVLIAEESERINLPFDIQAMNIIFFDHTDLSSATRCRKEIISQLKEAFSGAIHSPVSTSIYMTALQSGDKTEQGLADIMNRLNEIHRIQEQIQLQVQRENKPARAYSTIARYRAIFYGTDEDLFRLISAVAHPLRIKLTKWSMEKEEPDLLPIDALIIDASSIADHEQTFLEYTNRWKENDIPRRILVVTEHDEIIPKEIERIGENNIIIRVPKPISMDRLHVALRRLRI